MRRLAFALIALALGLAFAAWWWIRPAARVVEVEDVAARVAPTRAVAPTPTRMPTEPPKIASAAPEPAEQEREDPKHAAIRDALAETFAARFPDRDPSDAELERMASALTRMMAARDAMRALEGTPDEGGERRRLRDAVGEAVAEFEQVARVPLSEVTKETGAGGLSNDDGPEEDVVFETMETP